MSLQQPMDRESAENAIEALMRKAVPGQRGAGVIKGIQPKHVQKVIKSRALQKTIGEQRATKVWGWLAKAVTSRKATLKLTTEWTNEWVSDHEHKINSLRADAAWMQQGHDRQQATRWADREEAVGSIRTWMTLNEEPPKGGFQTLRTERREALRSARSNLFRRLGGKEAMHAALALMAAEGVVMVEQGRGSGGKRTEGDDWIAPSLQWAEERGWLKQGESRQEAVSAAVTAQNRMRETWRPREGQGQHKILDVGEGWGSIGIAVSGIPGCATVGLDVAGFLDQGEKHGQITSRLKMDLSSHGTTNVLRRAAKLASRKLESFAMVWLSPECRILTAANNMNVSKGCTNGRQLDDPRNQMCPAVLTRKKEEREACHRAIENQMQALEEESEKILFAMENPTRSDLWEMEAVTRRLGTEDWRLVEVDQCAYGRKCRKPTRILTNIRQWKPTGLTGSGRCLPLKCGGTKNNKPGKGQARHEQQMITSDPARKPREGEMTENGRREYSVKAGKNLVRAELVQEIVRAALEERGKGKK